MLTDQHLHTFYSADGRQTVAEACAKYHELGFRHICFTEHMDLGHPEAKFDCVPNSLAQLKEIEIARAMYPDMRICLGVENGDCRETRAAAKKALDGLPLDFRLLSLHMVDGIDCFDQRYFEGRSREEAYRSYARQLVETLEHWDDYDSVAHIGYCCKFAPYDREIRPFVFRDAPKELDAALRSIIDRGKVFEINTSGVTTMGVTIPHVSILKRYVELGGEAVTFGTDSHALNRDGDGTAEAMELAKSVGIRAGVIFTARKPEYFLL